VGSELSRRLPSDALRGRRVEMNVGPLSPSLRSAFPNLELVPRTDPRPMSRVRLLELLLGAFLASRARRNLLEPASPSAPRPCYRGVTYTF
jgi:hypothetical protein